MTRQAITVSLAREMPTIKGSEDPNDFDPDGVLNGRPPALYLVTNYGIADGCGVTLFDSDEGGAFAYLMSERNIDRNYVIRTCIRQETAIWEWISILDNTYWNETEYGAVWNDAQQRWEINPSNGDVFVDLIFEALFSYASGWATHFKMEFTGPVSPISSGGIRDTDGNTIASLDFYVSGNEIELTWYGYPIDFIYLTISTSSMITNIEFYGNLGLI